MVRKQTLELLSILFVFLQAVYDLSEDVSLELVVLKKQILLWV